MARCEQSEVAYAPRRPRIPSFDERKQHTSGVFPSVRCMLSVPGPADLHPVRRGTCHDSSRATMRPNLMSRTTHDMRCPSPTRGGLE